MTYIAIDPVVVDLGFVKVHWYGVMYLLSFLTVFILAKYRIKVTKNTSWDKKQLADLVFYGVIGTIVGGRSGYIIFYQLNSLAVDPLMFFRIWNGGMSFHGGLLGVIFAMFVFAKQNGKTFFKVADFVTPLIAPGLFFGRIANYINSELWGKVTTSSFGVYAKVNGLWINRYPSQLYEALLEGVVLFLILWIYSNKRRPEMAVSSLFLIFYGIFRFLIEFVRAPDGHIGYLAWGWLTMGQVLSLPMAIVGVFMLVRAYNR